MSYDPQAPCPNCGNDMGQHAPREALNCLGALSDVPHANGPEPLHGVPCEREATIQDGNGREVWVGRLQEDMEGETEDGSTYRERYCLHIDTPFQSVVFGLDGDGDAGMLALVAAVLQGWRPVNENWVESLMERADTEHDPMLGRGALIADPEDGDAA